MRAVDSTFLIDLLQGKRSASAMFHDFLASETLATTQINAYEVYRGAFVADPGLHKRLVDQIRRLLDSFEMLPLTREATVRAGYIWGTLRRQGREIGDGDALIAGILLANGCNTIVTNDSHFERVEGLTMESY